MRTENRIELTDKWLRNVEPAAAGKRETKWDVAVPGLGVRITDKGAVSFFIMKRIAGRSAPERPVGLFLGVWDFDISMP